MAPVDVAWLRMEHPTNLMMVTALLQFEGSLDLEQLNHLIDDRLLRLRRFRERVIETGTIRKRLCWQIDPHFELTSHVRRIALPQPSDYEALREQVSQLMSTPLDPTKPLWQIHLIEGYRGGCALLVRIHHCIGDGMALMQVLLRLADEYSSRSAEPEGGAGRRGLLGMTGARLRQELDWLVHPAWLVELARDGAGGALAAARLLLRASDPRTCLKGQLGVSKEVAWSESLALSEIKMVGQATGSTVNDVLLAALSGALGRYLKERGDVVSELDIHAAVPVNLRRADDILTLGNRFGLVFVPLPMGMSDPLDRLFTVRRRMQRLKESPEAGIVLRILGTVGRASAQSQRRLVELVAGKTSAVITNVPGPSDTLSLGGVPVRSMMFWVPMSGRVAVGISIFSYAGRVRLGIASDAGLMPDPETVANAFQEEFAALLELARRPLTDASSLPVEPVPLA